MRSILLITVMLGIFSGIVFGIEYSEDISQWISVTPPQIQSDVWNSAGWSNHEWQVYLDKGRVCVRSYDPGQNFIGEKPNFAIQESKEMRGQKYTFKVPDGWLIGFNAGEWGGSLWWFSDSGKESYKISDDQIRGYIQKDDALFAIEGLAHLGISEGKVIKIIKNNKTGKYESVIYSTLSEAPDAVTLDNDGSMVIVTTSGLIKIASNGEIKEVVKSAFWSGLYANSIVLDPPRNVYIGMRQGVAKFSISESEPKTEWLVPNNSFLNEEMESYKKKRGY